MALAKLRSARSPQRGLRIFFIVALLLGATTWLGTLLLFPGSFGLVGICGSAHLDFNADPRHSMEPVPYAGDPKGCNLPEVNLTGAIEYGCMHITKVCVDQERLILHSMNRTTEPIKREWGWMPDLTPGWEQEITETGGVWTGAATLAPFMQRNGSLDRKDIRGDPIFSKCYLPVVWHPPWTYQYAEWYSNSVVTMYWLEQHLKLWGRDIMLMPIWNGMDWIPSFGGLMEPFTNKPVVPLHEVGSRAHIWDPAWPRCFENMLLCNPKHMHRERPPMQLNGDPAWWWHKPGSAGQYVTNWFRKNGRYPAKAETKKAGVLDVFLVQRHTLDRQFLDVEDWIRDCSAWVPPAALGFKSTHCRVVEYKATGPAELAELQLADILVGHHGAGLTSGYFMRPGTSTVEVRMHQFEGGWPDQYFKSQMRLENITFYWQVSVREKESWEPAIWEKMKLTEHRHVSRDRHTHLRWPKWVPIFERILAVEGKRENYEKLSLDDVTFGY